MGVGVVVRARDRLLAAERDNLGPDKVCRHVVAALHEVASFDRCALLLTDPQTMLPSGGVIEGFDAATCAHAWDNQLLDPDVNKYSELARRADHLATLSDSLDGELERSARYRRMYADIGASVPRRPA